MNSKLPGWRRSQQKTIDPEVKRILLIAVPGIGDAFLATPLLGSLKRAYPDASIDVLVREGRSIVEHNRDVSRVLVQGRRPRFGDSLRFLASIFRRYDLAISTSTTDRSFVNLFFAAPQRFGKVANERVQTWWKRKLVTGYVPVDHDAHLVSENLRLADALGIEKHYLAALPARPSCEAAGGLTSLQTRFAVLHMKPGAALRQWPEENWCLLIEALRQRGLSVIATGSSEPSEIDYVEKILARSSSVPDLPPVHNMAGVLSFGEVAALISRAAFFVGTDTSTTHLAAATGVPTLALFGPTSVVRWGPWPQGLQHSTSPWSSGKLMQTVGNVTILRAHCHCSSVQQTCFLQPGKPGVCMNELSFEQVLDQVDRIRVPANHVAHSA